MTLPVNYRKEAFLHGYGLAADRPLDALPGTFYYSTDTSILERFNGTTWDNYSPISASLGEWNAVAFNASDYAASGSMIWTVSSGAINRNSYAIVGNTVFWSVYIQYSAGSILSGTASNTLYIYYPAGITAAGYQIKIIDYQNGVAGVDSIAGLVALMEGTRIAIIKGSGANYALSDTPGLIFNMVFEKV